MKGNSVQGLTGKEASRRLFEYGENRLANEKKISALKIFAGQFKDLMILILLVSTVICVIMGDTVEAIAIITIVLLNAILGFVQEFRVERTLETLKNMAAPSAQVLRDGKWQAVPSVEVVPGDVISVKSGYKVPADARLLEVVSLSCDEAMLSGESVPVDKRVCTSTPEKWEIGRDDMIYMGTVATKGRAVAEVISTGMNTEMGKIAGMLTEIEEEMTPLQKRLQQLGKYIAIGCLLICTVVSVTGVLRGEPVFDMFITGISLAVAAVPEGLPAIVTIALALAVGRILKRNALVRKLHSMETLGCANVICTDKTGTLTENKMTARKIFTMDYKVDVSGNGYEQGGEFTVSDRRASVGASETLRRLLDICVQCTSSQINSPSKAMGGRDRTINLSNDQWQVSGEPTEISLLVMAAKGNVHADAGDYEKLGELPFDSDRKRMTVLVKNKNGKTNSFSKGAPDILLEKCRYYMTDSGVQPLSTPVRRQILAANEEMASGALRVLGFAYKAEPQGLSDSENDMVFVGLVGMIDPPRREAYDAVIKCKQAKIRVVMITGDHKITACAIAKDLGIMKRNDLVMTGAEMDAMSQSDFEATVHRVSVFARVNPGHKLKIVRALKKRGDIVAMTGDGVNDAPAIKEADIGVSMGITGTDVTKQAASIILLDDNFATLVASVEEGRVVYSNIRKFIRYLLSCNIGEVLTMFVGMLMGMPVVLLPIQILLVNLATDGLPAMALGLEPAEDDIMSQKPRPANESVFSQGLLSTILFRGCLIGLTTLAIFATFMRHYGDLDTARTGALVTLIITQLFHVFECKSERHSLFGINLLNNPSLILAVLTSVGVVALTIYHPWMQGIFSTVALTGTQLLKVFCYALVAPLFSALIMLIPGRKRGDVVIEAQSIQAD
ncbi:cation-translocating P-type ATPase [Oscillospiraceae bacterium MB08-C2-2]|nr:cation-translocating P-type ATPase [Oscillospiraceae bacterium MB08-C2-2]